MIINVQNNVSIVVKNAIKIGQFHIPIMNVKNYIVRQIAYYVKEDVKKNINIHSFVIHNVKRSINIQ